MKKITLIARKCSVLAVALVLSSFSVLQAQEERIAVLQEPFVILLDPSDGTILDPEFIDLTPLDQGTPKDILQVGQEIWISDQLEDRIDRFDLDGILISSISTGLDNVKGMELVDGEVWICNSGTGNGAPGDAIVRLDLDGNSLGFYPTDGSIFDIIDVGGEVYISYIIGDTKIERRDYDGNILGNIVEEGVVSFIQQMELNPDNNSLYAAVFSPLGANEPGLYEFSIADGSILNYWDEGGLRGVINLEEPNMVLISSAAGYRSLNTTTGVSTPIGTAASSQYFGRLNLAGCIAPDAPTGEAMQSFTEGATLEDIVVSPTSVTWFATEQDATTLTDPLSLDTVLEDNTTYYAVTVEGDCASEPFAVTVFIVLGLDEFDTDAVVIYPNPASTVVHIRHEGEAIDRVSVYSLLGQRVIDMPVNSNATRIDISGLAAGVYVVKLEVGAAQKVVQIVKSN